MSSFTDKFMEIASKIGSQKHMIAIRDSFATVMPLMLAGSVAVLINALPGIINGIAGTSLVLPESFVSINGAVWWGTFAILTVYIVLLLGYNLAKSYDINFLGAMVTAFASFVAIASTDDAGWLEYAGTSGLLLGMIIAIVAVEIFRRFASIKSLEIKMPDGVPPAVMRSFAALVPCIATIFIMAIIGVFSKWLFISNNFTVNVGEEAIAVNSLFGFANLAIQGPMSTLANNLGTAIVIVLLVHVMWIFGLHGPNILEGPIQTIFADNMIANIAHFMETGSSMDAPFILTKPFLDTFVYLGGSGVTLGLLISIFLVGRSKTLRTTAKLSIGPGAFNINEPVIFGIPIILNPILAIPFIIAPVVLTIISYAAAYFHIVGRTVVVTFWATPPIISGFIATGGDFKACLLQIINLAISIAIYIPFVIIADKQEIKKEKAIESNV